MQTLIVLSVFDKATGAYMRPWYAQTEGQALRLFIDELRSGNSPIKDHPEDYSLFQIGTFEDSTGELTSNIKCLARAHELIAQDK